MRSFVQEVAFGTLRAHKAVAFFMALACFCFAGMVQMSASMLDLSSVTMGVMIFTIGIVLAVTTFIMAVTTAIDRNTANIAVMKAFGYSEKERVLAVCGGYVPFAFIGFALGTVYQYVLLKIMTSVVFKDIAGMPDYAFDVPVFFVTLAVFVALYAFAMLGCARKISKVSVKYAFSEE